MLFITSITISIITFRGPLAPGQLKYSSANTETWRPFCRAHGGPTPPPSDTSHPCF